MKTRLLAFIVCIFLCFGCFAEEAALQFDTTLDKGECVTISITAVGDCTLGDLRMQPESTRFRRFWNENGAEYFLSEVKSLFERDDFTIVNLEGPITTNLTYEPNQKYYFRGEPEYIEILTCGSVEVCNLANNHSHNFDQAGYDETGELLTAAGIGWCGYDDVYYTQCKGITVGFAGFDMWRSTDDDIVRVVTEARLNCDLLIVSYHGGTEMTYTMHPTVQRIGRLCIDAGADLFIGNHSHVYGAIEQYKGKYLIGSLGNFCFGGNAYPDDLCCTIWRQDFNVYEDGTVEDAGIDILPAHISTQEKRNNYQPTVETNIYTAKKTFNGIMKVSNFKVTDALWLEDSYAVVNGLVEQ